MLAMHLAALRFALCPLRLAAAHFISHVSPLVVLTGFMLGRPFRLDQTYAVA